MLPFNFGSSLDKISKLTLSDSFIFEKLLYKPIATFQEFFCCFLSYHLLNKFDWSDFVNEKNFKSMSEIEKHICSYKNKIYKNQRKIDSLLALNKNLERELESLRLHKLHFIFEQSQKTFLHSDVDFSLDDFKSFLLSKKSEQKISANLKKNPRKPIQTFPEISTDCSLVKAANLS